MIGQGLGGGCRVSAALCTILLVPQVQAAMASSVGLLPNSGYFVRFGVWKACAGVPNCWRVGD